jgi:hypothetical protein
MAYQIPSRLLGSAYLAPIGEPAWPKNAAIETIDWATKSSIAVLGVEIWLPTLPGPTIPTPYIYQFETTRQESEDWRRFLIRANDAARNFVETFDWDDADKSHHGKSPVFNLTFSEEW